MGSRQDTRASLVLDCGCGNGRWSSAYVGRGFTVIGVDLSKRMLESAIHRLGAQGRSDRFHAIRSDIGQIPVKNGSVDIAHLYGVIEHLQRKELEQAIDELSLVLTQGGLALIDVPQRGSMAHLAMDAARKLGVSRVPLFRFYGDWETQELVSYAAKVQLKLLVSRPSGYWYSVFPLGVILDLFPGEIFERMARLIFRRPLGLLLILSKIASFH